MTHHSAHHFQVIAVNRKISHIKALILHTLSVILSLSHASLLIMLPIEHSCPSKCLEDLPVIDSVSRGTFGSPDSPWTHLEAEAGSQIFYLLVFVSHCHFRSVIHVQATFTTPSTLVLSSLAHTVASFEVGGRAGVSPIVEFTSTTPGACRHHSIAAVLFVHP